MSAYIVPILVVGLLAYSVIKKNNTYSSFVFGAKTSFELILISFPYLVAIVVALEVFTVSGVSAYVADGLSPLFNFFGIPKQLTELVIIKPFSGGGSLAVLENIFAAHGADSYVARAGSVVAGSSEAVFYVGAVYFSKTNVQKLSYGIPVALVANFASAVVACFLVRIM